MFRLQAPETRGPLLTEPKRMPSTLMTALQKQSPQQGFSLVDAPVPPAPEPGEVLVEVTAAGICGTDLHIDHWTPSYHFMASRLPVTLGHEFSGHVRACGDGVPTDLLGRLVTVRPSVVCGVCEACQQQRFDDCVTRRGIGVARHGAFATWVSVPARNCVPVPEGVSPLVAALGEPLTVSHEAVRTAEIRPGDKVLVLGPGNIGQGIALFARAAGAAQVVVGGYDDAPRMAVLWAMGFTDLIDFAKHDMTEALAQYTQDRKFDVVIEATGAAQVIAPALAVLKPRGVLVVTGIHAAPVPIDLTAMVRQHHQIRASYRAPEASWPEVVRFMVEHAEVLEKMVTHQFPLQQAATAFALAHRREATKVMLLPGQEAAPA